MVYVLPTDGESPWGQKLRDALDDTRARAQERVLTTDLDTAATADKVVKRLNTGQINVPATPTATGHAASKSYVDTQDGLRAPLSHTHAIADVTGLQAALDAKVSAASSQRGRKVGDQSKTGTGLVDLTFNASFAVGASEEWDFEYIMHIDATTTSDITLRVVGPTGGALAGAYALGAGTGVVGSTYNQTPRLLPVVYDTNFDLGGMGGGGFLSLGIIRGAYIGGANAGTVKVQFASASTDVATVKDGATWSAVKV